MARYFALEPLVLCLVSYLALCLVSDAKDNDADSQSDSSTSTTSPNIFADTSQGPPESLCQYNLIEIVNNNKATTHVVNIIGSESQTYTIRIKDKYNDIRAQEISKQTAFEIPFEWLRPCTEYTISVDDCTTNESNTFTSSQGGGTVPNTVVESLTDNEVCLKGEFTDIQWNLTECVRITEQNSCTSTHTVKLDTCTYTMNIDMPPVKPEIRFNATIPNYSQFEWTNKPARCNDTFKVICNGKETYRLNDKVLLLLNKQYTCVGEYHYEKRLIESHALSFQIPCDGQKNGRFQPSTSTSLKISWNSLEGDQCSGITWDKFSASCRLHDSGGNSQSGNCVKHSGTMTICSIRNLLPYKNYLCSIIGKVNRKYYEIYTGVDKTLSDKPIFRSQIEVNHPSHNSLEIKCENKEPKIVWNGGQGTFTAEITYNGETISKTSPTCSFSFSDLYYRTTYDVKITAKNTEGHSAVIKSEAATKYNDKAVIGSLIGFLIIVTSVVLLKIYLVKRKRISHQRDDNCEGEDEDCIAQDILTTCEYVNVPMRVHRMETKQQTSG